MREKEREKVRGEERRLSLTVQGRRQQKALLTERGERGEGALFY